MKFYNREEELKLLQNTYRNLKNSSQLIVLTGRRRIGKTRLVLASLKGRKYLYFFVEKKNMAGLLESFCEELKEKLNSLIVGKLSNFDELLKVLFEYAEKEELIVIFDEVSNFRFIEPGVFSTLQKYWDINKETSRICLVFIGSMFTMMKKIFFDSREPLFGRATLRINLFPLPPSAQKNILMDLGVFSYPNLLHFYSIFGGVPKYLELIEDLGLAGKSFDKIMETLFFNRDAMLKDEGRLILIEEFGKKYPMYFSILQAIARGKTRRNEIADACGIGADSIGPYLYELENYYELIERKTPIFTIKQKSKMSFYRICDHFFRFWFRFIYRYSHLYEIEAYDRLKQLVFQDLATFEGLSFEELIKESLVELNKRGKFKVAFSRLGSFWTRKGIEIDIVCVDEEKCEVFFGECKLSLSRNPEKEIQALKEKSGEFKWKIGDRKDFFGLFVLEEVPSGLKDKEVVIFSLKDLVDGNES